MQVSLQVMMLDVINRRMSDRQCMELCPQLTAELAAEAASHGPLVLMQLRPAEYGPLSPGQTPPPLFLNLLLGALIHH
jgi:hypothetical protein